MEEVYQVIVRFLDGKSRALNFTSASIPAISIKNRIFETTAIPIHQQRLISNGRQLEDAALFFPINGLHQFPTVQLLLRLRGGKGGFGSLLRGAATKAGQKKTNNFDACRDMSGRRLRHVNAEKKLEEWRAEAEERRLEKIAEEFIKKKSKAAKKSGGSGEAEKYVDKYRKDSAKCMEEVEKSVRESIGSYVHSKRKAAGADWSESKRLKIWMGKRKLDESDSDDMDEDDSDDDKEEANERSVVIDNGNNSDSSKEVEGGLGFVAGGKLNGESSGRCSSESGSEEEEIVMQVNLESSTSPNGGAVHSENDHPSEPALEIDEEIVPNKDISCLQVTFVSGKDTVCAEMREVDKTESGNVDKMVGQPPMEASDVEIKNDSDSKSVLYDEAVATGTNVPNLEKPLNFDEFNSAVDLEVLGMERLKSELQAHGLKCGGTLQERAARLFLLKTTPLEMLPKKLLAKK